jgi:hypothetical protein
MRQGNAKIAVVYLDVIFPETAGLGVLQEEMEARYGQRFVITI